MRNRKRLGVYLLLFAIACSGLLFQKQTASAEATSENYYLGREAGTPKNLSAVNDLAGIYTPEQIAGFETKMQDMQKDYDCNVVAFIIDNEEYNSSELSAPEQVSEVYLPLDDHKSTVVLWLNVCQGNRSLYLLGYGTAETKIDNDEADNIAYDLQGYVREQQSSNEEGNEYYVKMMDQFIYQTDREMRRPYFFMSWWFHLAVSVVIGLFVVLILVRNIAGRMSTNGSTYINNAFSKVIGRQDIYTHTTYVRTKKSSSSGGRSGGGHSHSSGGGRF